MSIRPSSFRPRRVVPALVAPPRPPAELRGFSWSDLFDVMEIERASFQIPLTEMRMRHFLERPSVVCTVAERSGSVCGFAIVEYGEQTIRLLGVAVAPHARRLGVGRLLVCRVRRGLECGRWRRVETLAPEESLGQLLWLKALGFMEVPDAKGKFIGAEGMIRFRHEREAGAAMDTNCTDTL